MQRDIVAYFFFFYKFFHQLFTISLLSKQKLTRALFGTNKISIDTNFINKQHATNLWNKVCTNFCNFTICIGFGKFYSSRSLFFSHSRILILVNENTLIRAPFFARSAQTVLLPIRHGFQRTATIISYETLQKRQAYPNARYSTGPYLLNLGSGIAHGVARIGLSKSKK